MIVKKRHRFVADRFRKWQESHAYFSIEHQARVFDRMADEEFQKQIQMKEIDRAKSESKSGYHNKV